MERRIIRTADGSTTIQIEGWNEQYHSLHGAIQEARHVFIKHGLSYCMQKQPLLERDPLDVVGTPFKALSILEIGFGTGLNAFITLLEAEKHGTHIQYTGVEAYPVSADDLAKLNYVQQLQAENHRDDFYGMHSATWNGTHAITPFFTLTKQLKQFQAIDDQEAFDLIYFDAFGARIQPELWTESVFKQMFDALKPQGILVTYAAKGSVRRAMQSVGFLVEKLPGPPGKREMLRAEKCP